MLQVTRTKSVHFRKLAGIKLSTSSFVAMRVISSGRSRATATSVLRWVDMVSNFSQSDTDQQTTFEWVLQGTNRRKGTKILAVLLSLT